MIKRFDMDPSVIERIGNENLGDAGLYVYERGNEGEMVAYVDSLSN